MLELRHRHRLRRKEIARLADDIEASLGVRTFGEGDAVDMADAGRVQVILLGNQALGLITDGAPFLTVRGLLRWQATKGFVSVDEGAVRFICNGADVMGPGIVETDPGIRHGDMVWVRDARHRKPLAIGRALVGADVMASRAPGKAVKTIHHVGDELWGLGRPE
ncbi:MAG: PUA domain-containing protein [Thermoplasmatota archaeon]